MFDNYFAQQQTFLDDSSSVLPDSTNYRGHSLDNIAFIQQEVRDVFETLQLGKSTRPDNVNNGVLKELTFTLSKPLCDLFNHFMSLSCRYRYRYHKLRKAIQNFIGGILT